MLDNEQGKLVALHIANVLKSSPEYNKCFPENRIKIGSAKREIFADKHTFMQTYGTTEPLFFNRRKIYCSLQHSFCEIAHLS